jgi:hypothetical protein
LHRVTAQYQALHDAPQRHGDTVDFGWKSFRNDRNAQAGWLCGVGFDEEVV